MRKNSNGRKKSNQESKDSNEKEKLIKRTFLGLSISLTFISIHAGFYFYYAMFGLTVAVSASMTFEIMRLVTIFGSKTKDGSKRIFSYILYTVTACVCAFAAIASFHAKIIRNYEKDMASTAARQKTEIGIIKTKQSEARESDLARLRKDINWCLVRLAKYPDSKYWSNRLDQMRSEEKSINSAYDSLLSFIPEKDIEGWIEGEFAKYSIERAKALEEKGRSWAISSAIKEMWGVSEVTAKKIAAIAIVLGVEFGIIILAVLSADQKITFHRNGKFKPLIKRFGEGAVIDFIQANRDHFALTGKLLNESKLSKKNREIRKMVLSELNDGIDELMGIEC